MKKEITIPTDLLATLAEQNMENAENTEIPEMADWYRGRADVYKSLLDVWATD